MNAPKVRFLHFGVRTIYVIVRGRVARCLTGRPAGRRRDLRGDFFRWEPFGVVLPNVGDSRHLRRHRVSQCNRPTRSQPRRAGHAHAKSTLHVTLARAAPRRTTSGG